MTIRSPGKLLQLLADTSPLRWGFDTWGAIAVVSTVTVFACGLVLCLLSFAFPPPGVLLMGLVGSFLVGLAISMAGILVLWVTLTPIWWLAHGLVWKLLSERTGPSHRDR